jgi:oxygen-dependent protoporphyrinogen oxidase
MSMIASNSALSAMSVNRRQTSDLDVAIVGGGISGLAVAHRLASLDRPHRPLEVRLFEASDRLGGLVQSESRDHWLFEAGPDSIVTAKRAAYELCRELGLGDELLAPRSGASFSLVHEERLHPLPEGFRMIAPTRAGPVLRSPLFSWKGKLRMLLEPWLPRSVVRDRLEGADRISNDESVESFVVRRFGREVYDRVAEPVFGGLFVADASCLSARRGLGPFVDLEARFGSVTRGLRASEGPKAAATEAIKAPPPQLTLKRGMSTLVHHLVDELPASWLQLGCAAKAISRLEGGSGWRVESAFGIWRAREIVLACPAPRCHDLLRETLPELAQTLHAIRFTSCVTVNLVYRRRDLMDLPKDFGFFVPRSEGFRILAANYSSEKFSGRAPDEHVIVRTFQGGALEDEAVDLDDAELIRRSHLDLTRIIGAQAKPIASKVSRFRKSMPQFEVDHFERIAALEGELSRQCGLHVVGSGMGAYGLPDCIASGERAAEAIRLSLGA